MTEKRLLKGSPRFWRDLIEMVAEYRAPKRRKAPLPTINSTGMRPPVRFITHQSYSTYTIRTYGSSSYDPDGDSRSGQEYVVMVDGEVPVPVSLLKYAPGGTHKQMVSFVGDNIAGSVKLIFGDQVTSDIQLDTATLTEGYLTQKLEALTNIGDGNVKVSVWPGRWLIEFVKQLEGHTFDLFEVDIPDTSVFKVHVHETVWADSGVDAEVLYPIPMVGEYDPDDEVVNDAVAAGSLGTAQWFPGTGWVVDVGECRSFNGDGTPDL